MDRYTKIIAGVDFMKFDNLQPEDFEDIYKPDPPFVSQVTDLTMEEMISMQSHLPLAINRQTSGSDFKSQNIDSRSGSFISKRPFVLQKRVEDNGMPVSREESEIQQLIQKSRTQLNRKFTHISNNSQEQSSPEVKGQKSLLMHMFTQKEKNQNSRELLLKENEKIPEIDENSERRTRTERVVKDGVDLMNLEANKPSAELESSFELVLVTLSKAFNLKPKQAAALLTNNNQYLVTACIKGAKGSNYEPVLAWFSLLQEHAVLLADLLYFEAKQLPTTAKQTFMKVMAAIACGFYSNSYDVVKMTFSLFCALFEEFLQEAELQTVAMKWFFMNQTPQDGSSGLKLVLYATKHHLESCDNFMKLLLLLCPSNDQLVVILKDEMQTHSKTIAEYIQIISDLLPSLNRAFDNKLNTSGLLDFWVEMCAREAENDGKHTIEERITALGVLSEIWMSFTEYVDQREEMANTILFMLKRAVRERCKSIRLAASAILFRILDSFGESKNKAAPVIYKTLIFALVENPSDPICRSFYLSNFQALFESNKGIPVQLLVEPLFKQMSATLVNGQNLKIFDFDFFVFINSHPKFSASCALLLLELLGRIILGENRSSRPDVKPDEFPLLSYYTLAQVPFLQTCFASLLKATGDNAQNPETKLCVSFIQQFLSQCVARLFDLEPVSRDEALKQQQKRKEKGIVAQKPDASKSIKTKDLSKSTKKLEQEVGRKLQKTFTVITMLKIQNMLPPEAGLNQELRKKALEAQVEFMDLFGYENKGITQILTYYGDPSVLMSRHLGQNQIALRKSQIREYGASKSPEKAYKQRSVDDGVSSSVENYVTGSRKQANSIIHSSRENTRRPQHLGKPGSEVGIYTGTMETETHALVPYKDSSSQNSHKDTKSRPRQRAMEHIERIKKQKEDKVKAAQEQEQKQREASAKRRKLARDEVEKRKIELGVADKVVGIPAASLIQESSENEKRPPKSKPIALIDLNNDEEDRDTKPIQHVMSKFSKLWRNLFNKYQNAGFEMKKNKSIEESHGSVPSLSLAELNKLLRDHDTLPQLVSKDELATLVRLINMKLDGQNAKADLQSVTFPGFQQLMIQLSLNCFTRPPRDMTGKPTFEHLQALIGTFHNAIKNRGMSTLLYEENEGVVLPKDKELIAMLTTKLETEPDYPLPEGFSKVKELRPVITYEVPAATAAAIGEARTVSISILDDLCAEVLGIHVLQAKVRLEERFKVKPKIQQTTGKSESEALEIMKKHDKKLASRGSKRQPGVQPQAEADLPQKGPPKEEKPAVVQKEPTMEEIQAQKAEAEAKKKKREEYKAVKEQLAKRDQERQARKEEEREKKKAEDDAKRAKEERAKAQKLAEQKELKEKVQKFKQEREEKKKQEEDEKREAEEEEAEAKQEEREEFFAKQREEFEKKLKLQQEEKKKKEQQQALKEQKEKDKRVKLQSEMANHYEQGKIKRQKEQELANTMDEFLATPDISEVLIHNDKGLQTMFKFYCKQQKQEKDEDIPFLLANMHYSTFTRFAHQRKIVPRIATVDDTNKTFRDIVRYYKQPEAKGPAADNSKFTNYIDYQMFIRALVRLALFGKDTDPATELEMATAEAMQQLKDEFAKEAKADKDFDSWLADKEAKGQGVKAKLGQSKRLSVVKRTRATSVSKQAFGDVDITKLQSSDLQSLCSTLGIKENGEIDEKSLEERQKVLPMDNFSSTQSKNTLGRINMKQQTKPENSVIGTKQAANEIEPPKEWETEVRGTSEMSMRKENEQTPEDSQQQ